MDSINQEQQLSHYLETEDRQAFREVYFLLHDFDQCSLLMPAMF